MHGKEPPSKFPQNLIVHTNLDTLVKFKSLFSDNRDSPESLERKENKIRGLKLHKIVWYNHKLKARISWEPLTSVHEHPGRCH